jgi:hypothetical protein
MSNAVKHSVYSRSGLGLQLALITGEKNQNGSFKEEHFSVQDQSQSL